MIVYPHINPIAFQFKWLKVRWYGIMYLVGFAAAWWLGRRRARASGGAWKPIDVDDLIFFAALGVIVGGRIGYMLIYGTEELVADPLSLFRIWDGGMSFHGGLVGSLIAVAVFAKMRGRSVMEVFDFCAPLPC